MLVSDTEQLTLRWFDMATDGPGLKSLFDECYPREQWQLADFNRLINTPNRQNVLKVLTAGKLIVGAIMYSVRATSCRIRRVAVREEYRRRGFGRRMLAALVGPNSPTRRRNFTVYVREDNLAGLLFIRDCGLGFSIASKAKRPRYNDHTEGYVFRCQKESRVLVPV